MKKQMVALGLIAGGAYIIGKAMWTVAELGFGVGQLISEMEAELDTQKTQHNQSYCWNAHRASRKYDGYRCGARRPYYHTYHAAPKSSYDEHDTSIYSSADAYMSETTGEYRISYDSEKDASILFDLIQERLELCGQITKADLDNLAGIRSRLEEHLCGWVKSDAADIDIQNTMVILPRPKEFAISVKDPELVLKKEESK